MLYSQCQHLTNDDFIPLPNISMLSGFQKFKKVANLSSINMNFS